ncbi:hypothetical protein CAS74_001947 [Pichia kudriavzevii]|uniref:3-oxoacyl-[acyl-carrier-protein] synthase n=1 Tax=Pichia kudriavzevii TaxID=4909 RepID=A0A1Z8JST4_PICKU|nr:hypothetical protein CAS74_001947 [Pichia kudriavzevii]
MYPRRVVITGLGAVTPLGLGVKHSWEKLITSKSGLISTSQLPDASQYSEIPSKVVGKIPTDPSSEYSFIASDHFASHELRRYSPFIQYALVAAEEALKDAKLNTFDMTEEERWRTGVCIGSGIGSFEDTPMFIPRLLTNMASGNVSIKYGLKGINHSVSTACATGVHSIGDSYRFIKDDYADVIVCGASEAALNPVSLGGFARAKSVTTRYVDEPTKASRPFDRDRSGFVLGEGAGILILEELEHAKARGAPIYAELKGYGLSGDATHITTPSSEGDGAKRAMEMAIWRANIDPRNVGYVNAHATSTVLGDRAENFAIKRLFEVANPNLKVSSSKGQIGHLLGAAGMHDDDNGEDDFIFDYVSNKSQKVELECALTNSFGFGGTNASLCLQSTETKHSDVLP